MSWSRLTADLVLGKTWWMISQWQKKWDVSSLANVQNSGIFIACDHSEAWLIICICVYQSMNGCFFFFFPDKCKLSSLFNTDTFYLCSVPGRLIPVNSVMCCCSTYPCRDHSGYKEERADDNAWCVQTVSYSNNMIFYKCNLNTRPDSFSWICICTFLFLSSELS